MKIKSLLEGKTSLINEIPHTGFDSAHSAETKFKDTLVDFRFQFVFRDDKEAYKKFLMAFMYGDGVYAKFDNHYIHISQNYIKKTSKPKSGDLVLPDNWIKFAKIIRDN